MGVIYKNGVAYGKSTGGGSHISESTSIPRLFINVAALPTTKDDVNCEFEYENGTTKIKMYGKIKCQGTSSMSYPKKNFTIKLYSDAERTQAYNYEFKYGWGEHSKYCLKANFVDHSHMRNIISGNIWKEVVESRSDYASLPSEIKNAYNHGAVDGFPFKLYANGHYEGLYTWNIPKADWMFDMDTTNPDHVALCAEVNSHSQTRATACNFKKTWSGTDGDDWSIEVGDNSADLVASVNNAISFVINSTDNEFISNINTYFDLTNLIDYYIFAYYINAIDNLGKNMIMLTYDMTKWYLSPYDLDSTYGNYYTGGHILPYDYKCPQYYEEQYNHLFERLWDLFPLQIKARYAELRDSVLTAENVIIRAEDFSDLIGTDLYNRDVVIYPSIPNPNGNNAWQIEDFMYRRQSYVDGKFNELRERVACTGITIPATYTFTTKDTAALSVTLAPTTTTDRVFYSSNDTRVLSIDDFGVMTPHLDGAAIVTVRCGNQTATCTVTIATEDVKYTVDTVELIDNDGWSEMADGTYSILHRDGAAIYFPEFYSTTGVDTIDIFMYNLEGQSLGHKEIHPYTGQIVIPDPNTHSINVRVLDTNQILTSLKIVSGGTELTSSALTWVAGTIDNSTGVITEDATSHTWFSEAIDVSTLHTVSTTCVGSGSSYNYKGCVMYDNGSFLGITGTSDQYNTDYSDDVLESPTSVRLTVNDLNEGSLDPVGKVRIFDFDRNYFIKCLIGNSTSAGGGNLPYLGINNQRITIVSGEETPIELHEENTSILKGYLIPIPSDATCVKIISPEFVSGMALWTSAGTRALDPGWASSTVGFNQETFTAGQYSYVSSNFKTPSSTLIPLDTDTSRIKVVFEM